MVGGTDSKRDSQSYHCDVEIPLLMYIWIQSIRKNICAYYNLLEETLQKNNLSGCPAQIYNMDKTGMPLDPRPPNVVAK